VDWDQNSGFKRHFRCHVNWVILLAGLVVLGNVTYVRWRKLEAVLVQSALTHNASALLRKYRSQSFCRRIGNLFLFSKVFTCQWQP